MSPSGKIALIETDPGRETPLVDKTVSFRMEGEGPATGYIGRSECDRIYDEVFKSVMEWSRELPAGLFVYKGVDLIEPYRVHIFYHVLNLMQKRTALKNMVKEEDPTEIWVQRSKNEGVGKYPGVEDIIGDIGFPHSGIKFFGERGTVQKGKRPVVDRTKIAALPADIFRRVYNFFQDKRRQRILISSDLHKIPVLLDELPEAGAVFIRESLPLRHFRYLLGRNAVVRLFDDYVLSDDEEKAIRTAKVSMIESVGSLDTGIIVGGFDAWTCTKKFILGMWEKDLEKTLRRISQAHRLFENGKFKGLLADEDKSVLNNILIQTAHQYDCPTFVNMHGEPTHPIGYVPLAAKKIFVWGKRQEATLIGWGMDEKSISVVGCTKYDILPGKDSRSAKRRVCSDMGLDDGNKLVVIAPRLFIEGRDLMAGEIFRKNRDIIDSVASRPGYGVVVKLHPGDSGAARWKSLYGKNRFVTLRIVERYDPLLLAAAADAIVVEGSRTFAMDGLACRKPVVLCDADSYEDLKDLRYFYDGTTKDKLNGIIDAVTEGRDLSYREGIERAHMECLDSSVGRASKRLVDVIIKN